MDSISGFEFIISGFEFIIIIIFQCTVLSL